MKHGKESADFLRKNYKNLQGSFPEMAAISKIIALHDLSPDKFLQGLSTLDRQFALSTGPVDLQKLAVILKTADILHTDNSRIAPIGIDTSAMDEFDLKKHQAREAISGWIIDGSQIILKALPETEEHLEAVHGCAEYMKNKEWPAVEEKLADYGFPHTLVFQIDESCLDTSVPDIAVKPTTEVSATDPNAASRYSRDSYVFNVPYREKGAGVVGREETLQTLRKQLTTSGGTAIGQTASFHGIGGLGKTQLAVEYAYHYKDTYPHGVIWIASDQEIEPQLVQVAKKGNWIAPESEHKLILEIARRRLKTFSDCLIIFDNVESLADIRKYLPEPEARPHIILTSRVPQDGFASIDLSLLSPELSLQLLLLEAGREQASLSLLEKDAGAEIVEELGRLPLAIELAGAYLKNRSTLSLTDYLAILKKNPISALPKQFAGFTRQEADLYRRLQISEETFQQEPLLKKILNVLAWSGSTFMGLSLLARILDVSETELPGPLSFGAELRIIRKDREQNRYEIHRLLRTVQRRELPLQDNQQWTESVCEHVGAWFQEKREEFLNLPVYEAEIDHLKEWQNNAGAIKSVHNCRLLWLQAYPPYHLGNYTKSFDIVRAALDMYGKNSVTDPELGANLYNDLGSCYGKLGKYDEALKYFIKALEIREKVLGTEHRDTAASLNNIGLTYGELGDHNKALKYNTRALEIREKVLGPEHSHTATSLSNVGGTYGNLGDHNKALKYQTRALEIREKVLGPEHPHTAASLNNVGGVYGDLGDHNKALEYQTRALEILEKVLGTEHPDTASSLNNVGFTYGATLETIKRN
jgi:tetratricopeptide (TPR) repeat protein